MSESKVPVHKHSVICLPQESTVVLILQKIPDRVPATGLEQYSIRDAHDDDDGGPSREVL